jgi:hypothetical protein
MEEKENLLDTVSNEKLKLKNPKKPNLNVAAISDLKLDEKKDSNESDLKIEKIPQKIEHITEEVSEIYSLGKRALKEILEIFKSLINSCKCKKKNDDSYSELKCK